MNSTVKPLTNILKGFSIPFEMKRMHLRSARRKAKLTQAELAKRLHVTQGRISKLERGDAPPPRIDEDERIAAILSAAIGVDDLTVLYGKTS